MRASGPAPPRRRFALRRRCRYPRGEGFAPAARSLPYRPARRAGLSSGQGAPGRADTRSSERAGRRHDPSRAHHPHPDAAQRELARAAPRSRPPRRWSSWSRRPWCSRPPWPLRRRRPPPRSSSCRRRPSARAPRWPTLQEDLQTVGQKVVEAQAKLDEVNQRLNLARREPRARASRTSTCSARSSPSAPRSSTRPATSTGSTSSPASRASPTSTPCARCSGRSPTRTARARTRRSGSRARPGCLEREVEKDREEAVVGRARGPAAEDRAGPEAGRAHGDPPGRHQAHQEDPRQRRARRGAARCPRTGSSRQLTWAKALLVAMRFPVTADNMAAVTAWEMAEGGHWYNTAYYNPLEHHPEHAGSDGLQLRRRQGVHQLEAGPRGDDDHAQERLLRRHPRRAQARQRLRRRGPAVGASPWGTGDFSRLL